MPRQMPLTPPEHYGPFNTNSGGMQASAMSFYNHNTINSRYGNDSYDSFDYGKQSELLPSAIHRRQSYIKDNHYQADQQYVAPLSRRESTYEHSAVPLLPPIQVPDNSHDVPLGDYQEMRPACQQTQVQSNEDKAVGGVAAHLDYEMEQMVDFVSEMAQGMYDLYQTRICLADIDIIRSVHPNASVPAAFRKYVQQILSSTRLPSSTILLGLFYLATRMGMLSSTGRYTTESGSVYRMLTTALLLGSKFLDDNTFQNRSWSEVSNIPVKELNELEIEWLLAIKWNMHARLDNTQGFVVWLDHWASYKARKVEITLDSLKLTPLDVSIQRQRSINKQFPPTPMYSSFPESPFAADFKDRPQSHWQASQFDQWPAVRTVLDRSPPSAPNSGTNTPSFYGRFGTASFGRAPGNYASRTISPTAHALPSLTQLPAYHTGYNQQPAYTGWGGHGFGCACDYCQPSHHDRFMMAHNYGAQTVAG